MNLQVRPRTPILDVAHEAGGHPVVSGYLTVGSRINSDRKHVFFGELGAGVVHPHHAWRRVESSINLLLHHVLRVGPVPQVFWSNAQTIAAQVEDFHPLRAWAVGPLGGDTVYKCRAAPSTSAADLPVPSAASSRSDPHPASAWLVRLLNLVPEPVTKRNANRASMHNLYDTPRLFEVAT